MAWKLNIPKILHVYWGGGVLHYLRFMTIKTFMKHNPDWEVRFYYPKYPTNNITWNTFEQKYDIESNDFTAAVMKLPIRKIPVDFRVFGLSNEMPEVHKSDFIRLDILSTAGGLWSDMDIIYTKPMDSFYLNKPKYRRVETFYCNQEGYGHSIGFLMGCKNNRAFGALRDHAKSSYNERGYQSIGSKFYGTIFPTEKSMKQYSRAENISMEVVYSHDWTGIKDLMTRTKPNFTEKTLGLHWYAGSPLWKDFIKETNGGQNNVPDCIIGDLLKQ